ncbi:hypothetical protein AB0M12_40255 [Nocardia vinacea]|uniref:hypothetical protein n=1 Tax=Nocardia vinacea TaxID=96468 RepID=UPI00341B73F8
MTAPTDRFGFDLVVRQDIPCVRVSAGCHAAEMGMDRAQSAKDAVATAEQYVKDTIEVMNVGRSNPDFVGVIDELRECMTRGGDAFMRGRVLLTELDAAMGTEQATFIGVTVQTAEAAKLWRRHRVVYRVHPGLADSLLDTDTRTAVPCEVFARLPHPDPFVVFPTPVPAPVARSSFSSPLVEPPVFVGMLVTAMTEYEQLCSTADPQAHQLSVALASRIHYEGQPPSHDESVIYVPLSGSHSIDDLIELLSRYESFGEFAREDQRRVYNLALSLLLYLCSDHRDARAHRPEAAKRGRKTSRKDKAQTIIDMGFDVGPALHAARRDSHSDNTTASGGPTVRAHLRRAHWHTYWTGPREAPTPEVRWLHPILVNRHRGQSRPTLVEVTEPETAFLET